MRALLVAALLTPTVAAADTLKATREQPMFEVSHTVDVRLEDGVAVMRVKRQFANPGKVADEAGLAIDLPTGAAATALRIRAHERWYDGELMERAKAAALYHEMTGLGAYAPKDPALLQWLWADKLYLQVFPVMPGEVSTVEYTLTVPTRYAGGRYWVSYPRLAPPAATDDASDRGLPLATPIITVHPAWGNATTPVVIDGKRAAPDTPIVLSPPVHQAWEETVGADPGGSYVASTIEVPAESRTKKLFGAIKIAVEIKHTYKGDLRVELIAPDNQHVRLFDRQGGGDNNIITTFEPKFAKPVPGNGTWRLVVSDHAGLDNGSIDKWTLALGTEAPIAATDTPIFVPDAPENGNDAGLASIAVAAPTQGPTCSGRAASRSDAQCRSTIPMWTARLGKVVASKDHAFGRLEIEVAPQVAPLPKRAQLVFAIDTSFSGTDKLVDAELAVVRTYLAHVPDAEVELVTYQRRAARVFGKFVAAKDVPAAIAAARTAGRFALGNGSALDEAALLATALLADRHIASQGPHRLVVMSDHLLRSSLANPAASVAKLAPDVVVHVVTPHVDNDDRVQLERVDTDALAPVATKHHGIYAELTGMPTKTDKELTPVVLELVRPTRIEKLALTGGFTTDERVLHEGEGLRLVTKTTAAAAADRATLTGVLWSDPVKKELVVNDAFSRSTAAWVFGEDEYHDLSEAEQLKVAFQGRAVSPVTSYVAAEPGTRPSTIGLETLGHGSGSGAGYGVGGGRGGIRHRMKPHLESLVDTQACVAKWKPAAGWSVHFDVETTKDEIVDVATPATTDLAKCLVETVWSVRLDAATYDEERETFSFELR